MDILFSKGKYRSKNLSLVSEFHNTITHRSKWIFYNNIHKLFSLLLMTLNIKSNYTKTKFLAWLNPVHQYKSWKWETFLINLLSNTFNNTFSLTLYLWWQGKKGKNKFLRDFFKGRMDLKENSLGLYKLFKIPYLSLLQHDAPKTIYWIKVAMEEIKHLLDIFIIFWTKVQWFLNLLKQITMKRVFKKIK